MTQPSYWCIANIGDVDPMSWGGKFILVDRRGIYDPIMLVLEPVEEDGGSSWEMPESYKRHTVELAPLFKATDKSLSDNKFHPNHEVWFGSEENLNEMAKTAGIKPDCLMARLLAGCPLERAFGYLAVIENYGIENFESYPCTLDFARAEKFCEVMLSQIKEAELWDDGFGGCWHEG